MTFGAARLELWDDLPPCGAHRGGEASPSGGWGLRMTGTASRPPSHVPIAAGLRAKAKRMRHSMTDAERLLWCALRGHRLPSLTFRRQVPVANFIVDFACRRKRLIVEVDGATHSTTTEHRKDEIRTAAREAEGYRVLRFWNDDIYDNLPGVLDRVAAAANGENGA